MHLVHNERMKLRAAWFNTMATALVAAGLFAPLAAMLYGLTDLRVGLFNVVATALVCVAGGCLLHLIGWTVLGRLRE